MIISRLFIFLIELLDLGLKVKALQLANNYIANKQAVRFLYMHFYQVTEKERVDNDDIKDLLAGAEDQW